MYDYYDEITGVYYDYYGNAWDVLGTGIFDYSVGGGSGYTDPVTGEYVVTGLDAYALDPGAALQTDEINYWLAQQGDAPIALPDRQYTAGYILSVPTTALSQMPNLPPVLDAKINPNAASNWDKIKKALAAAAKKGTMTAGGGSGQGGGAGARPAAVQPNQAGQCPTGYQKNAQGICVLPQTQTGGILSNPLYLFLGAILLILVVKGK